ncbi:MAG: hypothetical protein M1594_01520 [Candidatus Marsarchaeota archaeon]|nr:hypothetical protein [Candidatus Marsarchaeota archaeon]
MEKIKRKISSNIHLTTLVITLLIFAVGVFIGIQIASQTTNQIQQQINQLEESSYNLQLLTLINSSSYSQAILCSTLEKEVGNFQQQTFQMGSNLQFLESKYGSNDASVLSLKVEYSTLEARDFMLLQKINEECGNPYFVVGYFYSNENCSSCGEQGGYLTSFREAHSNVMVYSFDMDLESQSPEIELLSSLYSVSSTPEIVIPGKVLTGIQTQQQLNGYYNSFANASS